MAGAPVVGFRAPSFSLVPGLEWAFDILLEEGYRYDSSLFPIRRPGYGYPGTPHSPHEIARPGGTLVEFPLTVLSVAGADLPAAGGGYFRHFPYAITRAALASYARRGTPATFYIHPWEVDPHQPRLPVPALQRLRHYGGIRTGPPARASPAAGVPLYLVRAPDADVGRCDDADRLARVRLVTFGVSFPSTRPYGISDVARAAARDRVRPNMESVTP